MKVFGAREFTQLLADDKLRDSLVVSGMVKKADDAGFLLFDPSGRCARWTKIPIEMIEEGGVKWFGKVACKDHEHDYVELTLKWPREPEAIVLAELLKQVAMAEGMIPTEAVMSQGPE